MLCVCLCVCVCVKKFVKANKVYCMEIFFFFFFLECIWSLPDWKRLKIAHLAYFHAKFWPRGTIFALFKCFDVMSANFKGILGSKNNKKVTFSSYDDQASSRHDVWHPKKTFPITKKKLHTCVAHDFGDAPTDTVLGQFWQFSVGVFPQPHATQWFFCELHSTHTTHSKNLAWMHQIEIQK